MAPEEATSVYENVKTEIDRRLPIFPYNFSMSDGLLYLDHISDKVHEASERGRHSEAI
jgi:hypothetical protein